MSYAFLHPERYQRSAALFERALRSIPAGVNSTARAQFSGWEPHPIFADHGDGAHLVDVDGNEYVDYLLGLGPMLLGHRPPEVTDAVVERICNVGTVFALPTALEADLADAIVAAVPSVEQVRLVNSGTEAVLYALRLARAYTGRPKVIRFEGHYHGFNDTIYWSKHPDPLEAGDARHPLPVPQGPGVPDELRETLVIAPWNDLSVVEEVLESHRGEIAALITEPVMCNTGCILPEPGYLEGLRSLTERHGVVLIFDEVITGFRLALGGAQERYGVTPDLTVLAKGLGGGFPVAAIGGRREIMELVADGTVSIAGTYSANSIAVAAAHASLEWLADPTRYELLEQRAHRLREGLEQARRDAGVAGSVVGVGGVLQIWFADAPIRSYRDAIEHARPAHFRVFFEEMLDRGVLFHPNHLENLFVSFAHTDDDIDRTIEAAREALRAVRARVGASA